VGLEARKQKRYLFLWGGRKWEKRTHQSKERNAREKKSEKTANCDESRTLKKGKTKTYSKRGSTERSRYSAVGRRDGKGK